MKNFMNYIIWPVVAGLVFGATVLALPALVDRFPDLFPTLTPSGNSAPESRLMSFSEPVLKAAPAVVSINSQQQVIRPVEFYDRNNPRIRYYGEFLDDDNTLGSGVIISPDGYIITSFHLLFRPDLATFPEESIITLHDGRNIEARIVAIDEDNDLALLKVDEENLPYIDIGPSRNLEVGEIVLAIGNPRNIGQSVSLGIISALLKRDEDFVIQTDAAINPGNSGGALIDTRGNLIGINSTIVSESGGSEGIGFATPADRAIQLMETYIASGPSGHLGVDTELARFRTESGLEIQGFRVQRVIPNGPADRAGIQTGDIILSANGMEVDYESNGLRFIQALTSHAPGETVDLEIWRDGELLDVQAVLAVGELSFTLSRDDSRDEMQEEDETGAGLETPPVSPRPD